ncbi:MAG: Sulfotransferase domain protein [Candidatus Scalindua brodae]|uniref:Sulfotransferase domain protein n=1 Tax=Candidatus Scalindua brodae TaxID=237368 RepID=A0A0B0EFM7_9BACT|nr:MAG: Sulfotransferase domain protein [Candidatus Scalindua brodae]
MNFFSINLIRRFLIRRYGFVDGIPFEYWKKGFGNDDSGKKIFCLSTGRAGTATLANIFSCSKNVLSLHEPVPNLHKLNRLSYISEAKDNGILSEVVFIARNDLIRYAKNRKFIYLETSPQVTFLANHLNDKFENCYYIHLIRNPFDVIYSGLKRKWYDGHSNDYGRITPAKGSPFFLDWTSMSLIEKNIWLWAETNNWIELFINRSKVKFIRIKSEDIFCNNQEVVCDLIKFIGCEIIDNSIIENILNNKINQQKTGEKISFREWSKKEKKTF